MKRTISKRFELNELEEKRLRIKAAQCGLEEGAYIRELIMNSQPVEAPPRQFYERMEIVNRIGSQIQQILVLAGDSVQAEQLEMLRGLYEELIGHIVRIKEIVSKARFFSTTAAEKWEHEVEVAKREGRIPPACDEFNPRNNRTDIQNPATDFDLGWNALGIQPPFLHVADNIAESDNPVGTSAEGIPSESGKEELSALDYASTRMLIPPKKEGDI